MVTHIPGIQETYTRRAKRKLNMAKKEVKILSNIVKYYQILLNINTSQAKWSHMYLAFKEIYTKRGKWKLNMGLQGCKAHTASLHGSEHFQSTEED